MPWGLARAAAFLLAGALIGADAERLSARAFANEEAHAAVAPGRRLVAPLAVAFAAASIGGAGAQGAVGVGDFFGLDVDEDGTIDYEEYMAAARETETPGQQVAPHLLRWYEELFDKADMDGSRSLDREEVEYLGLLARRSLEMSAEEAGADPSKDGAADAPAGGRRTVQMLMEKLDEDGDGKVSQKEFMKAIEVVAGQKHLEDVLDDGVVAWLDSVFTKADVSKDGLLDQEELSYATLLMRQAMSQQDVTEDDLVAAMFLALDKNEDNKIDLEELVAATLRENELRGDKLATKPSMLQRMQNHFAEADVDGDRSLDVGEARKLAKDLVQQGEL